MAFSWPLHFHIPTVLSSSRTDQSAKKPMAIAAAIACFFLLLCPVAVQSDQTSLIFQGFNESCLTQEGASISKPSGLLRLTNKSHNVIGRAFYNQPIRMLEKTSHQNPNASSFSTTFVFSIVPSGGSGRGGFGLAFTIAPSTQFPGAKDGHFLGLFNSASDGSETNHIFAVEFDTVNGHKGESDSEGNHVGININGMESEKVEPAAYVTSGSRPVKEDMTLESGKPIQAWIEYDGVNKHVNVTIAPVTVEKPIEPLISYSRNLTGVLKETMFVGFSASTGKKSSSHYILGWSFSVGGQAAQLNLSRLPETPQEENPASYALLIRTLLGVFASMILLGMVALVVCLRRKMQAEKVEDWELDCPHRFNYNDLYAATKGFKETQLIGVGGFGAVYKGVLKTTGAEIAVKKVTRDSAQGMKEFAAEIESLGRLRHKNLVNLQGWCKKKNKLLIVYDYIPHGSLDSLLYTPRDNFFLNWEQRFSILKGLAAGLLYLHEEWERVVIHRDVKPSNVLIDAQMNARLGDFGLARLYDHGKLSHTTCVVGTIGYLAPELAQTGKASKATDVFAYGVLLLEVASGRRPLESGYFILADWVMHCYKNGRILEAADQMLDSKYNVGEMELVLQLGLLCSHRRAEARPTMRRVIRFLNGDEPLPDVDSWLVSQTISDSTPSYCSSSMGTISFSSIESGR